MSQCCAYVYHAENFIFCVEEVDGSEPAKDVVAFSESNAVSSDDVSNDLSINHPLPKPKATFLRRLKRSVGGPEKKYFVPNRNNFLNLKVTGTRLESIARSAIYRQSSTVQWWA